MVDPDWFVVLGPAGAGLVGVGRWWRRLDDPSSRQVGRALELRRQHLRVAAQLAALGEQRDAYEYRKAGNWRVARALAAGELRQRFAWWYVFAALAIIGFSVALVAMVMILLISDPVGQSVARAFGVVANIVGAIAALMWLATGLRYDKAITAAAERREVWIANPDTWGPERGQTTPVRLTLRERLTGQQHD